MLAILRRAQHGCNIAMARLNLSCGAKWGGVASFLEKHGRPQPTDVLLDDPEIKKLLEK
jgi:hypothetical protein